MRDVAAETAAAAALFCRAYYVNTAPTRAIC